MKRCCIVLVGVFALCMSYGQKSNSGANLINFLKEFVRPGREIELYSRDTVEIITDKDLFQTLRDKNMRVSCERDSIKKAVTYSIPNTDSVTLYVEIRKNDAFLSASYWDKKDQTKAPVFRQYVICYRQDSVLFNQIRKIVEMMPISTADIDTVSSGRGKTH